MAIYKAKQFHIDIEEQDYPDADCKFMISLWHTPNNAESRELIAIGLSDNMPLLQSTRNKGNELIVIRVRVGLIHQSTIKKRKLKPKSRIEVRALLIRKSRS